MTIPTEVIMRMATLGLSEAQARAVADMLTAVETATSDSFEAIIEDGKEKGRERWRKWKSAKTNVSKRLQTTANVSQQLAGVEDKTLTSVIEPQEKKEGKVRACRLPTDFAPDVSWAVSQGLTPSQADTEAAKFRDYWSAKGSNATKTDWPATWRNWIRQSLERRPTGPPPGRRLTPVDVAEELLRKMETTSANTTAKVEGHSTPPLRLSDYRHG